MLSLEYPLTRASVAREPWCDDTIEPDAREVARALREAKACVPFVRESIGLIAWAKLVEPEPITPKTHVNRAYHKLREILASCALPAPRHSVHLCEAPGGFVAATREHAANPEWTWVAMSLESGPEFHETIASSSCAYGDIFEHDKWCAHFGARTACLVTGDGATEMNHDDLETTHLPLLVAQARVALHCVRVGGSVVLKFFEGMRAATLQIIAWLSVCFESVSVVKPHSSRATNSELYLVARGFVSYDGSAPHEWRPSDEWVLQTRRETMQPLATRQTRALRTLLVRSNGPPRPHGYQR